MDTATKRQFAKTVLPRHQQRVAYYPGLAFHRASSPSAKMIGVSDSTALDKRVVILAWEPDPDTPSPFNPDAINTESIQMTVSEFRRMLKRAQDLRESTSTSAYREFVSSPHYHPQTVDASFHDDDARRWLCLTPELPEKGLSGGYLIQTWAVRDRWRSAGAAKAEEEPVLYIPDAEFGRMANIGRRLLSFPMGTLGVERVKKVGEIGYLLPPDPAFVWKRYGYQFI